MGQFDRFRREKTADEIAEEGNALYDRGRFEQAIEVWQQGLGLLPQPLNAQEEAVWFQASIGDAYFLLGRFEDAHGYLIDAKSNTTGAGYANPFVMLRLGQCCYELGLPDAREYLLRAYMIEGKAIFEEDDVKYLEHISDLLEGELSAKRVHPSCKKKARGHSL